MARGLLPSLSSLHSAQDLGQSQVLVAQLCPTLETPWTPCRPPGPSVHRDFLGKSTGGGCHSLLQGIFPTQGSDLGLLHCRQILYHFSHQGRTSTRPGCSLSLFETEQPNQEGFQVAITKGISRIVLTSP